MSISRLAFLFLLSAPLMACASTLTVSADRGLLEEEVARLPPVKAVSLRATIKVDAPELAAGQKPGSAGDPSYSLEYPAREMLEQATQAVVARWFRDGNQVRDYVRIEVRINILAWDEHTDVFAWRPVTRAELDVRAIANSTEYLKGPFSSGVQKGEWLKIFWGPITSEHSPQYTRMIYRAMLIALDKAMADLAQHLTAPKVRGDSSSTRQ